MATLYREHPAAPTTSAVRGAAEKQSIPQPQVVECARRWLQMRRRINRFPKDLRRESVWGMLLELFVNEREGGIVYVKQLIITSGESPPAAIRLIDRMVTTGLVTRTPDSFDHRRIIVQLADRGRRVTEETLKQLFVDDGAAVSTKQTARDEFAGVSPRSAASGFIRGLAPFLTNPSAWKFKALRTRCNIQLRGGRLHLLGRAIFRAGGN